MTPAPLTVLPKPAPRDVDTFLLPHSLEAERSCLGSALVSVAAADYLVDQVPAGAFFRRGHRHLFEALRALRAARTVPDLVTVKNWLTKNNQLEAAGGPVYLASLVDGLPASSHVAHYAAILRDLQTKRALCGFANQTLDLVAAGAHGAAQLLVDTDRRLMELQAGHIEGRMASLRASLPGLNADLEWRCAHRGELTGISTGFPSLNDLTLGWQRADMVIIAARPSIGKTTFVLNTAVHAAQSYRADGTRCRVAIFSLEMRRRQLEYRILSQLSQVPLSRILGGHLGDPDFLRISEATCLMEDLAIDIDDRAGQTVWDIRSACRRLQADGGLDLVAIDYVQLMPGTLDRRGATRNEEVTDISRHIKVLADELAAPILLLSQLNRGSEDRPDPKPKLRDLRESGALEQDADVVAFLHRKNHREGGVTNCILEKMRNGPTGTINFTLDRDTTTFSDGGEEPAAAPAEERPKRAKPPRLFTNRRGRS
jgi:replicative DNA helicase